MWHFVTVSSVPLFLIVIKYSKLISTITQTSLTGCTPNMNSVITTKLLFNVPSVFSFSESATSATVINNLMALCCPIGFICCHILLSSRLLHKACIRFSVLVISAISLWCYCRVLILLLYRPPGLGRWGGSTAVVAYTHICVLKGSVLNVVWPYGYCLSVCLSVHCLCEWSSMSSNKATSFEMGVKKKKTSISGCFLCKCCQWQHLCCAM